MRKCQIENDDYQQWAESTIRFLLDNDMRVSMPNNIGICWTFSNGVDFMLMLGGRRDDWPRSELLKVAADLWGRLPAGSNVNITVEELDDALERMECYMESIRDEMVRMNSIHVD